MAYLNGTNMGQFKNNPLGMDDRGRIEFKEKIQAMLEEQRRKEKESNERTSIHNRNAYAPPNDGKDVRIQDLTEQNQELEKKYGNLVQKANTLVEAYRELKTENERLKKEKTRKESLTKVFTKIGESFQNGYKRIILWFNT